MALDLKDEDQKRALLPLVDQADIVIEQFRPGVMDRLGLGYEELVATNPELIYCSITGFGQTGPLALRAGHDLTYMSETGILALNPGPSQTPQVPPTLAADIAGGAYPAVMNILLALAQRAHTRKGMHIDVAMSDNLFPFAFWALAEGWSGGAWPQPGSHTFSGGSPRYQLYATKDGPLLAVAALERKFWDTFCNTIDLAERLREDRVNPSATIKGVAALIRTQPARHWQIIFEAADCCCSIVKPLSDAVEMPHFRARGLFDYKLATTAGEVIPALPLPLSPDFRKPAGQPRHAAGVGEHNGSLLETAR